MFTTGSGHPRAIVLVAMTVPLGMLVTVVVRMGVRAAAVGAGLGFERRRQADWLQTQTTQHLVEHVIVPVPQPARFDLQRDVPVAEVVTGTRQQQRGIAAHLRYRLVCSPYAHDHPVRVAE
jgi:hypothetical protein